MAKKNEVVKVDAQPVADDKRVRWVLARVDELAAVIKRSYVELAELLHEVSRGGYYRTLKDKNGENFLTLEQYVQDHLGWKDRKARYFISIYSHLIQDAGVKKEDLAELEWSKASQVARLPQAVLKDPKKVDKWITKAKKLGHRELEVEVNREKNKAAAEKGAESNLRAEVLHREAFAFYEGQHKNVMLALQIAQKQTGSDKKSHLLDLICTDFIAGRASDMPVKLTQILDAVERVFGCHVVAISKEDESILYGAKYAKSQGID